MGEGTILISQFEYFFAMNYLVVFKSASIRVHPRPNKSPARSTTPQRTANPMYG